LADYPALDLTFRNDTDAPELLELLHACLDEFDPVAIHEHDSAGGWRVFFRAADRRNDALEALNAAFASRLASTAPIDVPDDGWARRSQAQLTPVRVGRIVVAPPWAAVAETAGASDSHVVVIEPSMGFGTGHHATTRLCLRLLQGRDLRGARVIDVGTGSGVLAIAAWKLGASRAVAIDCDPDALQNARENVERNGATGAIDLLNTDLGSLSIEPGDSVTANLTSSVLQRYAPTLRALVRQDGRLIVSGFSPDELGDVERAFGVRADSVVGEGAWSAASFVTRPRQT
jgi:ribosomal protein L11 methyltransferase